MGAFSTATVTALTEIVTGGAGGRGGSSIGRYKSGPQLEQFLGDLNVPLQIGKSSRVPAVREALQKVNLAPGGRDVMVRIIEAAVDPSEFLDQPGKHDAAVAHLNSRLRSDGCEIRRIGHRFRVVSSGTDLAPGLALRTKAEVHQFDLVREGFDRALERAGSDPEGAVTAACTLIESVCKHLLDELGEPYPAKADVQHLSSAVAKRLGLDPARKDVPESLARDLKQILGGLQAIAGGVGALRTHHGDAHGRGKAKATIDDRIARLAIHAASTLSLFYIETWERRTPKRATPPTWDHAETRAP